MLFCGRLFPTACLYYHPLLFMSSTFLTFLKFLFCLTSNVYVVSCAVCDSLSILPLFTLPVNTFFDFFRQKSRNISGHYSARFSSLYSPIATYIIRAIKFHTAKKQYTPLALNASSIIPPIKVHTMVLRLFPTA